jgi:hypothetical protein
MAHQWRNFFLRHYRSALGKNPMAQARSIGCFPMAHQWRKGGSAALRFASLARRLRSPKKGTETMTDTTTAAKAAQLKRQARP